MLNNGIPRINICGVPFTNISLIEFTQLIRSAQSGDTQIVVTPNVDFIVRANQNESFRNLLEKADLSVCDSAVVYFSSRFVNKRLKAKITGFDTMTALLENADQNGKRIFLLGSSQTNIELAAANIQAQYPQLTVAGTADGYFDTRTDTERIVQSINHANVEYLFVGMGSPRQEQWAHDNKNRINAAYILCIGGLYDIYSGRTKRAPGILQKTGLEWFWRMLCEPRRLWRRYILEDTRYFRILFNEFRERRTPENQNGNKK